MYAIQNIVTGEFVFGTEFSYDPDANRQRTSLEQMLTVCATQRRTFSTVSVGKITGSSGSSHRR